MWVFGYPQLLHIKGFTILAVAHPPTAGDFLLKEYRFGRAATQLALTGLRHGVASLPHSPALFLFSVSIAVSGYCHGVAFRKATKGAVVGEKGGGEE